MTAHSHAFCPHCGYDLRLDTPIMINDFYMQSSLSELRWMGETVRPLTASERMIIYTLMKAYPAPVRVSVILDRLDSSGTSNVVDVFVCRIRKVFKAVGAPNPIVTIRNRDRERSWAWAG